MASPNDANGLTAVVDSEASDGAAPKQPSQFSWMDPHPIFVIILVGSEEQPFGIQKDFLCAKSSYFRDHFDRNQQEQQIEHVVNLSETPVEVFACAQNYIYTGQVCPDLGTLPSYEVLIGVWKLGNELGIDGLCDKTLEAMNECRRITQRIPATPVLVQVWRDTPEGSSIRLLFLEWAAEYMRSSESRAEFARSLPQEVLSELVIAMSSLDFPPASTVPGSASPNTCTNSIAAPSRSTHQLEADGLEQIAPARAVKRARHSDVLPNGDAAAARTSLKAHKTSLHSKPARASLPAAKPVVTTQRRRGKQQLADLNPTVEQKLEFCSDLLTRMVSGPGFWTRIVGPFKEPVDPLRDEVPDYFTKINRPMDLRTMKNKMDQRLYKDEEEFVADMRQIFTNCYTYWTKKDPMWAACERLEKNFEDKYGSMNAWISKMSGCEVISGVMPWEDFVQPCPDGPNYLAYLLFPSMEHQICPTHKHRLGSPANSVAGGIVSPQPAQGYGRLCLLPSRHDLQKLLFVTNCLSKGKAARAGPPCGVTGGLC
ncbi:hypothetical protein OOU_Y34scaffold00590g64 [Pyricularia oryzae Y34]|uniref:Uncharacterized protein n=1 Tax=Pyricularia oryzae (strain Y34) TaxID=1143189 RepID=A0AA97NW55_PYRO3|nr:hypothetical protein OOU_Y34scaffold00590g64 [Pyricularia oryzae Y34]